MFFLFNFKNDHLYHERETINFENFSKPFDEERFNYFRVLILPLKYDFKVLEAEMTFFTNWTVTKLILKYS